MNVQPQSDARRRFLRRGGTLAVIATVPGLAACDRSRKHLAGVQDALRLLDFFAASGEVASSGAWNPAQVFAHCAQSIEYSMQGFPEMKPALFQATVGAAAAGVFAAAGQMRHNLAEPIPGAGELVAAADYQPALQRLRAAFLAFQAFQGPLQPHFAYGALERDDYLFAHVLHLDNHLDELSPRPDFLV